MYRTSYETAMILAAALNKSGLNRARVSSKSIRMASRRKNLRTSFVTDVQYDLRDEFDWIMFDLSSGSFGAIQSKSLESAKTLTLSGVLSDRERQIVRRGDSNALEEAFEELAFTQREPLEDDED